MAVFLEKSLQIAPEHALGSSHFLWLGLEMKLFWLVVKIVGIGFVKDFLGSNNIISSVPTLLQSFTSSIFEN